MNEEKRDNTITTPTKVLPLRQYTWAVHVIIWAVLFSFPFIFTGRSTQVLSWNAYLRFFIGITSMMIVFYANYSLLVRKLLFRRKFGWFVFVNIMLIIFMAFFVHFLMEIIPHPAEWTPPPRKRDSQDFNIHMLIINATRFLFIALLGSLLQVTISWFRIEEQRKELEQRRTEAELKNLKSQINPHFLFNTLNNIYSLVAINPERAQEAIHDLSRLLRYVMYDSSQPVVTLEKDLDFVKNYVELMRIRLPESVELRTFIHADTPQTKIAPLLFISLIENAFKHGVNNHKSSFIGLDIHQEKDQVICTIINSNFPKDNSSDMTGSGIGLPNLQKRLELLYPGRHLFSYGKENDNFRAYLSINVK